MTLEVFDIYVPAYTLSQRSWKRVLVHMTYEESHRDIIPNLITRILPDMLAKKQSCSSLEKVSLSEVLIYLLEKEQVYEFLGNEEIGIRSEETV